MRWLLTFLLALPLAAFAVVADEKPMVEVGKLIDQLGSDDRAVRLAAGKKLADLDDKALLPLQQAARSHADPDVRLRAGVIAREIINRHWGEIRAFGAGSELKVAPPGLGYWLNRIALTPDGKHAIGCGGGLILYDAETGNEIRRILEVGGARLALALSADGRSCLTGHTNSSEVHLVEVPSFKVLRQLEGAKLPITSVALSADGTVAAAADGTGQIILWDVRTGKNLLKMTVAAGPPTSLAFSPDGKRLLSGHAVTGTKTMVRLWEVATGKEVASYERPMKETTVRSVAILPDGKRGLSGSLDGTLRLWNLETGKDELVMNHRGGIYDMALARDGKRALTAGFGDHKVRLWDLQTGKQVYVFDGHVSHVLGVAFSADGRRAASSDGVSAVRLWRVEK